MAQINFTLDYDFFIGLLKESKENAFSNLMECMLNQILKAESEEQLGAGMYERTDSRRDHRNGTRSRSLVTRLGKIELEVPRHRDVPFKTILFERYRRNEQALIETMMEMVLQGVSTRSVEKVTKELCGEGFSKSSVSEICRELDVQVNEFRERPLTDRYPFVMVDALYIKVREDRKVNSKAFMVAIGFNPDGKREVLGFSLCDSESKDSWVTFLNHLANRGLMGVDLFVSDGNIGIQEAVKSIFPGSCWQRCQAHFSRNILDKCPKKYFSGLASELKSMFSAETVEEARRLRDGIIDDYSDVCPKAMEILDSGFEDSMTVMAFPRIYRIPLRTTNYLERENREIRKRESVIGIFPNRESALRLIGAVLLDDSNDWLTSGRAFKMDQYFDNREEIMRKARKSSVA